MSRMSCVCPRSETNELTLSPGSHTLILKSFWTLASTPVRLQASARIGESAVREDEMFSFRAGGAGGGGLVGGGVLGGAGGSTLTQQMLLEFGQIDGFCGEVAGQWANRCRAYH